VALEGFAADSAVEEEGEKVAASAATGSFITGAASHPERARSAAKMNQGRGREAVFMGRSGAGSTEVLAFRI
jgi:mRNA degradation ribonuclease J1/J2